MTNNINHVYKRRLRLLAADKKRQLWNAVKSSLIIVFSMFFTEAVIYVLYKLYTNRRDARKADEEASKRQFWPSRGDRGFEIVTPEIFLGGSKPLLDRIKLERKYYISESMGLQLMTLTVDTVSNYSFINDICSKALTKEPETLSQFWAEFLIISFFGCILAQIACVFLLVHTLYGEYKEDPEHQTFALESRKMAVAWLFLDVSFEMILLMLSSVLFL